MGGCVRELIGASHVACGEDIGIDRREIVICHDGLLRFDAKLFESVARKPGLAPDSNDQGIEADDFFMAVTR